MPEPDFNSQGDHQLFDVIVIAMQRETTRRARISTNLNELGIQFRFLDAVDLSIDNCSPASLGYQPEKSLDSLKRELTLPEIGCFVSHRNAWRSAALSDRPTLILESDASLDQSSVQVLHALCTGGKLHGEMVMLNYHKCIPSIWKRKHIDGQYKLVKFSNRRAYCLASYLLSPEGGKKLADRAQRFYLTADDYATGSWIDKDIDLYAVWPACATMNCLADQSTIDDARQIARKQRKKNKKDNTPLRKLELALRNLNKSLRPPKKGL